MSCRRWAEPCGLKTCLSAVRQFCRSNLVRHNAGPDFILSIQFAAYHASWRGCISYTPVTKKLRRGRYGNGAETVRTLQALAPLAVGPGWFYDSARGRLRALEQERPQPSVSVARWNTQSPRSTRPPARSHNTNPERLKWVTLGSRHGVSGKWTAPAGWPFLTSAPRLT